MRVFVTFWVRDPRLGARQPLLEVNQNSCRHDKKKFFSKIPFDFMWQTIEPTL